LSDWQRLAAGLLRRLPPEAAHRAAVHALRLGLAPGDPTPDPAVLGSRLWGLDFANPIGLAAGFDKDAEALAPLLRLGFGFVEAGTVTPHPQAGNPRPRLFRLAQDRAVINRLGFNNRGMAAMAARLAMRVEGRPGGAIGGIVGVNIGCNRDTADPLDDYRAALARLGGLADYVVVNISSPNTPGLRDLQDPGRLDDLLSALQEAGGTRPLLVKIAPDLSAAQRRAISGVAVARRVDGLIVSNTTIERPAGLRSAARDEAGGLSGRPLFEPSTRLLSEIYRDTGGAVPLIGVGGVSSGADAYAKIRAGASLVQLYTALIYEGFGLVRRIKEDLAARLAADGFATVAEAVGADTENAGPGAPR
jgi:dihydroorotate dehydrogenase